MLLIISQLKLFTIASDDISLAKDLVLQGDEGIIGALEVFKLLRDPFELEHTIARIRRAKENILYQHGS